LIFILEGLKENALKIVFFGNIPNLKSIKVFIDDRKLNSLINNNPSIDL